MERQFGRWYWWVLCALWLAVIFGHSFMPAAASEAESGGLLAWLSSLFPFLTQHLLRKLAHGAEFALLGLLIAQCLRGGVSLPLLAGLFCALGDETIQLFIPGRSGEVRDVWIDFTGVAAAVLLVCFLRFLRRRRAAASE